MSDPSASRPPPLPVRRRDVSARIMRIAEIARDVAAGTYSVPAEHVAAALLDAVEAGRRPAQRR